ncbi:GGDEF domain-containing protein [Undibacterium sp. Di24W]|uniref:sensor domain-containing diguanylate cyclase n=1 Tax=Undibacterium sp. Di24W TaxID=3413033 RepID=UPI003BEF7AC9
MYEHLRQWRQRHADLLFAVYACALFSFAATLLYRAWLAKEFEFHNVSILPFAICSYVLAVFIILLGFSTPRFVHISLDRITQVGLVLILGPADAALINGLASFTYPLLAQHRQYDMRKALVHALHNSAMFTLIIYCSGTAYRLSGGAVPLMVLDWNAVRAFIVLVVLMQCLNGFFLRIRAVVMSVPRKWALDWYSHGIEVPVALVGLLTAMIYNGMSMAVFGLFLIMVIAVILIAKFLNEVTVVLKRRVKQVITINRVAKAISSSIQLDHLIRVVYNQCMQLFKPTEFYFCVRNCNNGKLECKWGYRTGALQCAPGIDAQKLIQYSVEHQLSLHLTSLPNSQSSFQHILDPIQLTVGSLICLPIMYNHEILGIIYISDDVEFALTHHHYKLMQAMCRQVSSAINNINMIEHLEEHKIALEQKVYERVTEIEQQKRVLADMNQTLEKANLRQEELLASLRLASAELERQNREDALTGLYNRRYMDEFLAREYARAIRQNTAMSIALVDVDHFKLVNDQFSHQVGDATLKALGEILQNVVRGLDMVARYGGEEILICLPDTELRSAINVCERARMSIQNYDWERVASGLKVTASFGVAQCSRNGVATLLANCDQKL